MLKIVLARLGSATHHLERIGDVHGHYISFHEPLIISSVIVVVVTVEVRLLIWWTKYCCCYLSAMFRGKASANKKRGSKIKEKKECK